MYRYETHLHTYPVSRCAKADVTQCVEYYKELGYDGIFITNHFLDGNINIDRALTYQEMSYEQRIEFLFSDYTQAKALGDRVGLKVFFGAELSYKGTDFLVYGLDKAWYLANPQIMDMKRSEQLQYMMDCGALVIQAHPFLEAKYINHIRLFPRHVHGVEIVNTSRCDFQNDMAKHYARAYELLAFAGSDNHGGRSRKKLAGMCAKTPIMDEKDFAQRVKNGEMEIFTLTVPESD